MDNALKEVLHEWESAFDNRGMKVSIVKGPMPRSYTAEVDGENFVGNITFWPEGQFEFQFNRCSSGEVVMLETKEFHSVQELSNFVGDLLTKKLN